MFRWGGGGGGGDDGGVTDSDLSSTIFNLEKMSKRIDFFFALSLGDENEKCAEFKSEGTEKPARVLLCPALLSWDCWGE